MRAGATEADIPATGEGISTGTGRAAEWGIDEVLRVPKTTALRNAIISRGGSLRVLLRRLAVIIPSIHIRYPFPDIPGHVQRPVRACSGRITTHSGGIANAVIHHVIRETSVICQAAAREGVSPRVQIGVDAAGGFLPFSLGGQAPPGPLAVGLGFERRDVIDRVIVVIWIAIIGIPRVGSRKSRWLANPGLHTQGIHRIGHFGFIHPEAVQYNLVRRRCVGIPTTPARDSRFLTFCHYLFDGDSHRKGAFRHEDHFHVIHRRNPAGTDA